jgi:hypothetical protein
MRSSRSFFAVGTLLVILGVLILRFARTVVPWDRIVIEDYHCEFDYPLEGWSITQERSTLRDGVIRQIGTEAATELEKSREAEMADLDTETISVNLFDMSGSAEIHAAAYPFSQEGTTVEMISAAMQMMHELEYPDYFVLYAKHVRVDDHDAFRRMETYTPDCQECSEHQIVVVTYVIENAMLYQLSLIEHNWLNLPRNLKTYNHIVKTFHIH